MSEPRKKICMLAATPLTIHFFLKPHLTALAKNHNVTLMVNLKSDSYVLPLGLSVDIIDIGISRKMAPISDLICLVKLFFLFRKAKYDLLITVIPKAGLLGMLAGVAARIPKRLHIFQGEVWAHLEGFGRKFLKTCDWITATLSTDVLAVSQSEKQFLIKQGVILPDKISVIGKGSIGGVDIERFSNSLSLRKKVRSDLKIPEDAVALIFLGRLVRDKGIYQLVTAFQNIAKFDHRLWLLLIGPDEEREFDNLNLGSLAVQTVRAPFTAKPEVYLAASDILVLPSFREGFGVVIIEAAAMGLPSIGSNIYGISDAIIEQETGLLFECGSSAHLQYCIQSLLDSKNLRARMGSAAYRNVKENFKSNEVVAGYVSYISNLLK